MAGPALQHLIGSGRLLIPLFANACPALDPSSISRCITLPPTVDESLWLYESLRCLLAELGFLLAELQTQCTSSTCPRMVATDSWHFLCAAHAGVGADGKPTPPRDCAAMDYCVHT